MVVRQGIIVGIPTGAHRGGRPGILQAVGVADGEVLDTAIRVVNQAVNIAAAPPEGHLQSVQGQIRARRGGDAVQPRIRRE